MRESTVQVGARTCEFPGCKNAYRAQGLCASHYSQRQRGRGLTPIIRHAPNVGECSFEGCSMPAKATGLCKGHYWQKSMGKKLKKIERHTGRDGRFWSNVEKGLSCWNWTGSRSTNGYGRIHFLGKRRAAHRVSWLIHHGEFPSMCVLHTCDNRLCVNPQHLWLGTARDNAQDMVAKGRHYYQTPGRKRKLNPEKVREIRSLGAIMSAMKIADLYGVSACTISGILHRRLWKSVE